MDTLQIADLHFNVDWAKLDAFVSASDQRLNWGFKVMASRSEQPHEDWTPELTSEILFSTAPGELGAWWDIAPRTITWTSPITAENDPWASLYMFEHEPMMRGTAEVYSQAGVVRLRVNGICAVNWDETYGQDLPLSLDTALSFDGVLCARDSEEEARQRTAPYLDGAGLRFVRDEYGVSSLRAR